MDEQFRKGLFAILMVALAIGALFFFSNFEKNAGVLAEKAKAFSMPQKVEAPKEPAYAAGMGVMPCDSGFTEVAELDEAGNIVACFPKETSLRPMLPRAKPVAEMVKASLAGMAMPRLKPADLPATATLTQALDESPELFQAKPQPRPARVVAAAAAPKPKAQPMPAKLQTQAGDSGVCKQLKKDARRDWAAGKRSSSAVKAVLDGRCEPQPARVAENGFQQPKCWGMGNILSPTKTCVN